MRSPSWYRQLSDYDKRNAFDIEKYRQHKLVVKPDDTFDLYDMGEVEADLSPVAALRSG